MFMLVVHSDKYLRTTCISVEHTLQPVSIAWNRQID